jgi:hypothetical protein
MRTPSIKDIAALLKDLKTSIDDDFRAYDDDDLDSVPSMLVTVGCDEDGNWSYQTGDTQFTGGAYGYPYWGQCALERRSNCLELARDIVSELREAQA